MGRTDQRIAVLDAPPRRVFEAFIDADALVEWLPPTGMVGRIEHFDPRPGGSYRMVLAHRSGTGGKAGGGEDVVEGRFIEIVPGERVVQAVEFPSDDPAFAGIMTMTWSVAASGAGSVVTFRADDVPEGISADDHQEGFRSSLENLAAFLAR